VVAARVAVAVGMIAAVSVMLAAGFGMNRMMRAVDIDCFGHVKVVRQAALSSSVVYGLALLATDCWQGQRPSLAAADHRRRSIADSTCLV